MILNAYTFILPVFWMSGLCLYLAIVPPFVVFIQMMQSDDKPEMRHRLHDTYRLFAIFIGLPAYIFAICWNMFQICDYVYHECARQGINC